VADLSASAEALLAQFGVLDNRVARVGRTAAHTGDRLSAVDASRARAEEAVDLISALALFDTDGEPRLGPLFSEEARLAEAAALTQRLLALAEAGAGAGLSGCARALVRLQSFANGLENRLVARFDAAGAARDTQAMAAAAQVLTRFNGGASLVARFVATRPMFLQLGLDGEGGEGGGEAAPPPASEAEACAVAAAAVRRLGAQFKELLRGAREEAGTVQAVFPAPAAVMATLVRRLLEQRVRGALEGALERAEWGAEAPAASRLARLLLLAGAYERTAELADRLQQLPGGLEARGAVEELFGGWREGYLEAEMACQRALGEADPFGCPGAQARLARAGDALARTALLLRAPRPRAAATAALVHALCVELIRQVRAGLDGACAAAALRCRAHGAATPAAAAVAEGCGSLVQEAGAACAVMAALRTHLADCAAPLLAGDAGARATAADSARQAGAFVEAALSSTLATAVAQAGAALERVLAAEQSRADFAPKAVGAAGGAPPALEGLAADRPTVACLRACALLALVRDGAAAALDGRNAAALLAALAERLVAAAEVHWGSFRFSPQGGLRLKRDVAEFAQLLGLWGLPPLAAPQRRLAELGALASLTVAPTAALAGLVNGEGLGLAVRREEALRWLALRADFRKGERPFSLLLGRE